MSGYDGKGLEIAQQDPGLHSEEAGVLCEILAADLYSCC